MSVVLGLDLALGNSGWASGADGKIVDYGDIPGSGIGIQRLIYNRNKVMDKVDAVQPGLVVIEDLATSRNMAFAKENAGLSYMIQAELFSDKFPLVLVQASSLKKFVCGSGGSKKNPVKKEHILLNIFKRFGHEVSSNDAADAIGLAYLGMALLGEFEPTIDAQIEVIEALLVKNPAVKKLSQKSNLDKSDSDAW